MIDALAHGGVCFRNAWSNPCCSPTRATLQTGRYSFRTGIGTVLGNTAPESLAPSELAPPQVLDRFAPYYRHAAFGKWHLGNDPLAANTAGWSHFAGIRGNIFGKANSYFWWPELIDGVEAPSATYATTATVDRALEWLASAPEPWLCYVAFNAPHDPFHAPPAHLHTIDLPNVDPRLAPRPFYAAAVQAPDTEIGRLLTGLGPALARTNVVFLGDNGTPVEACEPPFVPAHAKFTPYEGGLNVPLVICGPAVVRPGREVAALVNTTDLYATLIELAGLEPARALAGVVTDSVSVVPYLRDPRRRPLRATVFAELFTPNGAPAGASARWRAIRGARYKLVDFVAPTPSAELYDLVVDPFEQVDLLLAPLEQEAADALAQLQTALAQIDGS